MEHRSLTGMMPVYYRNSKLVDAINRADAVELTRLDERFAAVKRQFFIGSADVSLARWEQEYGLKVDNRPHLSDRRGRVLSKMRVTGTTTVDLARSVAQSFSSEAVQVVEYPAEYRFVLRFSVFDRRNAVPLYQILDEIKPAHLACGLLFAVRLPQSAAVYVGAYSAVVQRAAVYPYLPPKAQTTVEQAFAAYASTAIKLTTKEAE